MQSGKKMPEFKREGIKKLLRETDLSCQEIADRHGIAKSTVVKICNDNHIREYVHPLRRGLFFLD